jgi:hypothetical protein
MDNPLCGLTWLYTRKGRTGSADDLLRRLGRGEIKLTREARHTLQPWRAAAHLRELLGRLLTDHDLPLRSRVAAAIDQLPIVPVQAPRWFASGSRPSLSSDIRSRRAH